MHRQCILPWSIWWGSWLIEWLVYLWHDSFVRGAIRWSCDPIDVALCPHTHTHIHTHTRSIFRSVSLSLSHTHTHAPAHTHSPTHPHPHPHTLPHTHTGNGMQETPTHTRLRPYLFATCHHPPTNRGNRQVHLLKKCFRTSQIFSELAMTSPLNEASEVSLTCVGLFCGSPWNVNRSLLSHKKGSFAKKTQPFREYMGWLRLVVPLKL